MSIRRIDPDDDEARQYHNKCDDCCMVIGCYVCGPCPDHDLPDNWWVRSNVADRTLEWGHGRFIIGDYVDPSELPHILHDIRHESVTGQRQEPNDKPTNPMGGQRRL